MGMPKGNDWGRAGMAGKAGRSRKILLVFLLLLAACCYWVFGYEPGYAGTLVTKPARTLVFAHRGFGNLAPDNSLFAVEQAMTARMDGVDVDGQFTADSELVVFHDLSVDRLTSDTGRVTGKTLKEMEALDLGPEVRCGPHGRLRPHVRGFRRCREGQGHPDGGAQGAQREAERYRGTGGRDHTKHGAQADVVLSSFNPLVLWRIKKIDPNIKTALIFMDTNWTPELVAEIKKGDEVDLPWPLRQEWIRRGIRKLVRPDLLSINVAVDPRVTDRLIAKGWPVFLWTPDEPGDIQAALNKRPYAVISNEPGAGEGPARSVASAGARRSGDNPATLRRSRRRSCP
jgi:glycerophosphoryl diester phosphodiesterase